MTASPISAPTALAAAPVSASAFPDASSTGWHPTGVTLTASPAVTVTRDGAVIDGLDIVGNLDIKANNVTVRRSRITAGNNNAVRVYAGVTGFQLIDSEVVGVNSLSNQCGVAVTGAHLTIIRVDIHGCADGVHPGNGSTIKDSYIHDLWLGTDANGVVFTHNDGIQIMSGTGFVITHNRIDAGHHENAAVFVKSDFGPISDVLIDGNYLDGGSYTIFGADTASGSVTNVTISNNTFGTSSLYGMMFTSRWTGPTKIGWNVTSAGHKLDVDPVLVAVGNIACDPLDAGFVSPGAGRCAMAATAAVAASLLPDAVAVLGDAQGGKGRLSAYRHSYATAWGQFLPITRPTIGDADYGASRAATGYFTYFAGRGGAVGKGWYSYNVGTWHVVVLNSECRYAGGCGSASPQVRWLARDLAAHPTTCTLAYWHDPRFSSGRQAATSAYNAFWSTLYRAHVDVVLNGHDNTYERFAPMNPNGRYDRAGIREFVVGSGGQGHTPFTTVAAHSVVRNDTAFGVLGLTLHAKSYDWTFARAAGGALTDSGSGACH